MLDQFKGAMDLIKVLWPFLLAATNYVQAHVGIYLLVEALVGVFLLVVPLVDVYPFVVYFLVEGCVVYLCC